MVDSIRRKHQTQSKFMESLVFVQSFFLSATFDILHIFHVTEEDFVHSRMF